MWDGQGRNSSILPLIHLYALTLSLFKLQGDPFKRKKMSDYISHLKDLRMRKCREKALTRLSLSRRWNSRDQAARGQGRAARAGVGPEVHGLKPKLNKQTVSNTFLNSFLSG